MKMAYLFLYNDEVGTREKITQVLDRMSRVITWRYDMPHCYYVISESTAEELHQQFQLINGNLGRYLFIEASANRQGWMLKDTWYLLTNKTHRPKV